MYLIAEAQSWLKAASSRPVAQLAAADHLGGEPRLVEELAYETGTSADFLRNEPDDAKLLGLVAVVLVSAEDHTADEFARISDQAVLRLDRAVSATGPLPVVEAVAV